MIVTFVKLILLAFGFTTAVSSEGKQWCTTTDTESLKCNYFPREIPPRISYVHIDNFFEQYDEISLNNSYFISNTWNSVTHLTLEDSTDATDDSDLRTITFQSECFAQLKSLQALHVHVVNQQCYIERDAFIGLENVQVLDFSDCGRLLLKNISSAIDLANLRGLKVLNISRLNSKNEGLEIERELLEPLAKTSIKYLDMSKNVMTQFRPYQLHLLEKLEVLNLSQSTINSVSFPYVIPISYSTLFENLVIFDLSYVDFPRYRTMLQYINEFISILRVPYRFNNLDLWFSCRKINATGIIRQPFEIRNATIHIDYEDTWRLKEVNLRKNNLKYLNVYIYRENHAAKSIILMDLAENGLEFLHPSILSFMPNIEILDLSDNALYKMMDENVTLFENVFSSLKHLKIINLSANKLANVPKHMFKNNQKLERIDLSSNRINQVAFVITNADNLKILDLRNNDIKILDQASMELLDSIFSKENRSESNAAFNLRGNPLSCSECRAERFLTWLLKGQTTFGSVAKCIDENGHSVNVTGVAVKIVRRICDRQKVLIAWSVSSVALVLLAVFSFIIVYKRLQKIRKRKDRNKVLQLLQNGQGKFEFVAFLSYSSLDAEFVEDNVYDSLNDNLKLHTGIQRELVCSGDRFLRPGFFVLDETIRLLEKSAMTIIVLSDAYCASTYCHNELEQAVQMKRPIILMLRGHVNEELMKPMIKLLYKQNVRVLWKEQDGQYVLKTTWGNVCISIIDLIEQNR